MTSDTKTLVLPSGRTLAYGVYGTTTTDLEPPTVIYFHSFPATHHEAALFARSATTHGIRIIAASRPGGGGSTFQPNRTLLDFADDTLALVNHLRITRFAIIAVSGGAPYAFACWRRMDVFPRTRLVGMAIVAGMYPSSFGTSGMMLQSRLMLWIAPWWQGLVSFMIEKQMGQAARDDANPGRFRKALDEAFRGRTGPDRTSWEEASEETREVVTRSVREAVRYGGEGAAWEANLFGSPWGFELEKLEVEERQVVMWHGKLDVNVPVAMAEKAARIMEKAELRLSETDSHGSMTLTKAEEAMVVVKDMLDRNV